MANYPALAPTMSTSQAKHDIDLAVTFGASSAVSSYLGKNVSIAKTAAGKWDITLPMAYAVYLGHRASWKQATTAVPLTVHVTDISSLGSTTAATISIETVIENGTVTEPASGAVLYLTISVSQDPSNSTFGG